MMPDGSFKDRQCFDGKSSLDNSDDSLGSYSGGCAYDNDGRAFPYSMSGGLTPLGFDTCYGGSASEGDQGGAVTAGGTITGKYKWHSDAGNPPPDQVVVEKACSVEVYGYTSTPPQITCDDGFADPPVGYSAYEEWDSDWITDFGSRGLHSKMQAGGDIVTITITPSAAIGAVDDASIVSVSAAMKITVPYVSGTNCSYTFRMPDGFTGTLQKITITCNDTPLFDGASIGGGTATSPKGIHYDSTHFADEAQLKFHTVATNTDGKLFECDDIYLVYNKYGVIYMTAPGFEQSPSEDIPDALRTMHHGSVDGLKNTSELVYTREKFLEMCRKGTAMHFLIHGTPTQLTPNRLDSPDSIIPSDISNAIKQRGIIPGMNVVFAASCSTLADKVPAFPSAFGIDGSDDHAYVGFDAVSAPDAVAFNNESSSEIFWQRLSEGWTVSSATRYAGKKYTESSSGHKYPAKMLYVGDGKTTLRCLYGTATSQIDEDNEKEWVGVPDSPWFKLDAAP